MALSKSSYRGTRDFFPEDMRIRNYIFEKMIKASELYAYEPYDGPLLEEVDLYRAKSGEELINDQIYSFVDRGGREVAIRPEMTPSLARMVAQIHKEVPKPIRLYSIPNLMRYEKPQRGRLREFWQYNADIFGAGAFGEVEIIQLVISLLKSFGATEAHFEVCLNDRRFIDFVFEELIALDSSSTKKLYKLLDAKNKMNPEKFFTEVELITQDDEKTKIFNEFVSLQTPSDLKNFFESYAKDTSSYSTHLEPLINIFHILEGLNLEKFIRFDPSIVRGLDYYTGLVFEVFDKHPENRRAIAGGGAYANLLQIFNEPQLEGAGVGLGEVPLKDFLTVHDLLPDFSKTKIDYLVTYFNKKGEKDALEIADQLRTKNKSVELFFGEAKPKKVFNYSDKKNFTYIILITENEIKLKEVSTRNETVITKEEIWK